MLKRNLQTTLLFLLGNFSFGGTTGRVFGFAPFDILLIAVFIINFASFRNIQKKVFVLLGFLAFGLLITLVNIGTRHSVTHSYFITELRFFVYIPILYYIISLSTVDVLKFKPYLALSMLMLFLTYVLMIKGNFIYTFFNGDLPVDQYMTDRVYGPSLIFLSMMMMVYLHHSKESNLWLVVMYIVLILTVFIKSGSRQEFIINCFPLFYLALKRQSIWSLLGIGLTFITLGIFGTSSSLERFSKIFDPLGDSSFVYRLLNMDNMLTQMSADPFIIFLGNGIGSDYTFLLSTTLAKSFFLDNSFLTLVYKVGIFATVFFYVFLYRLSKDVPWKLRLFLIGTLVIAGILSYHIILNPIYLLSYFLVIRICRIESEKVEDLEEFQEENVNFNRLENQ